MEHNKEEDGNNYDEAKRRARNAEYFILFQG
jgi:hypothetical protein